MTPERWQQLERLYHEALAHDARERGAFLASACGGDEGLRREVESLLAQPASAHGPLDGVAMNVVAPASGARGMTAIGRQLGVYRITAAIGAGGMGEVYRATDTRLQRDVAIKILPPEFTTDADRRARFEREARILASLNHPNIAAIYGFEEADGVTALVLELVEGPTLADRIRQGPVALDEADAIARQIIEALEAAHEQGIIHRDLKPGNIKLRPDGTVKVLDFGLAKPIDPPGGTASSDGAVPGMVTEAGIILGTAPYMSPEQARGKGVDKRTDIWAFGAVLFEVLSGRRAFEGEDVSMTLSKVLQAEPDFALLPPSMPPRVGQVLRACLRKDSKQRLSDFRDVRLALDGAFESHVAQTTSRGESPRNRLAILVAGALLIGTAAGIATWLVTRSTATSAPELRLDITTPAVDATGLVSIAISPDGRQVVFATTVDGIRQLNVRSLDATKARLLSGTEGGFLPFWSPDGRSVGFFADGQLKRIDIAGGSVRALAKAGSPRGGAWNRDDIIVFAPSAAGPLFRIAAAGGPATMLTQIERPAQSDHRAPQFLPDGKHFLYYARGTAEGRGLYVGGLDGSHSARLLDADAGAAYAASGHILFIRQATLFAVRFDADRMTLLGSPFPLAERVSVNGGISLAALSTSAAGPIIYRAGADVQSQLVWVDRSGARVQPLSDPENSLMSPRLSPDGRQLMVSRNVDGNWDLWLQDMARGVRTRLTSDPGSDMDGVWSPDGSRVAFISLGKNRGLHVRSLTAGGPEEVIPDSVGKSPASWSSDGRFLLYIESAAASGVDVWALPLSGDRTPVPVAHSRFNEKNPKFSPDGHWVAYESDESGRSEIYVQQFPGAGEKLQISSAGGAQVQWGGDGKELFYIALDGRLMSVPMQLPTTGSTIGVGRAVPLFATHIGGAIQLIATEYDVARDGQHFLMATVSEDTPPISVILNWAPKP